MVYISLLATHIIKSAERKAVQLFVEGTSDIFGQYRITNV